MRIGRQQDTIALCITEDEYLDFLKMSHRISTETRLRCTAVLDPTESHLKVQFGLGHVFFRSPGQPQWRTSIPADECRAKNVALFGLTPTTYTTSRPGVIHIQMPDVRAPIRQYSKSTPVAARPRLRDHTELLTQLATPPEEIAKAGLQVSDDLLHRVRDEYNQAILAGYVPMKDGRGQILWFERKVGV